MKTFISPPPLVINGIWIGNIGPKGKMVGKMVLTVGVTTGFRRTFGGGNGSDRTVVIKGETAESTTAMTKKKVDNIGNQDDSNNGSNNMVDDDIDVITAVTMAVTTWVVTAAR